MKTVAAGLCSLVLLAGCRVQFAPTTVQTPAVAYDERITDFASAVTVDTDGTVEVRETITYDFGFSQHHGIFRDIPHRFDLADDPRHQRSTPITVVGVTSPTPNTPAKYTLESPADNVVRIRIGDPNRTINGEHTYLIVYKVRGALSRFGDTAELNWNVNGNAWNVATANVRATVTGPVRALRATCFQGVRGATSPCPAHRIGARSTRFESDALAPFAGLTSVTAFPLSAFATDATTPIIVEKPLRGFVVETGTVAALVAVGAGCALALFLALRRGRDRVFQGGPVDAAMGNSSGADEAAPLFDDVPTPVQFEPPDHLRPGQIGTLIDGVAHPLDVSATIVDLAARGHLTIIEVPKRGWFGSADWTLRRVPDPPSGPRDDHLAEYERLLVSKLFAAGDTVALSSLKRQFAADLQKVQQAMYNDLVLHRWFAARPDKVRAKWRAIGTTTFGVGIVAVFLLALNTKWMLAAIPVPFLGIAFLLTARFMPVRTASGTALVRRAQGFKTFMESFTETNRAQYAERTNLFYDYLPYAIVFGCTEHWAKVFEPLALAPPTWYQGNPDLFTAAVFAHSINGFTTTSVGTLAASAASTSGGSGFSGGSSGGGFGGGGGGSW